MLEVIDLSKSFGANWVVEGVSFVAKPGETYGLLGENGAGKTTLMRMIATVLAPSKGTARIAGIDITSEPEKAREKLGVLFESGLYDRLTAAENVLYFAHLQGLRGKSVGKRMDELFARLDLAAFRDRPTGQFSKGMKQKVALVRSIIHDPEVLLLDEPTSGLDVTASRTVYDFVAEQKSAGKTVIFSSHIMSEVERVCDRIGVIHRGRFVAEDKVSGFHERFGENLEEAFIRLIGRDGR